MRNLTELFINQVDLHAPSRRRALLGLTNLKSLAFYRDCWGHRPFSLTHSMQHLTRLTRLDTDFVCSAATIRHLTNLVMLRVSLCYDSASDECPSLNLEHLEDLAVHTHSVRGDTFSDLPRLKTLCIRDERAQDAEFIAVLGRLPQLSHFYFTGRSVDGLSLEYCLQFNLLSGLRSLSIFGISTNNRRNMPDPRDFLLEGSFPLLRWLHLSGHLLSQTQGKELMRRFLCLNSLDGVYPH